MFTSIYSFTANDILQSWTVRNSGKKGRKSGIDENSSVDRIALIELNLIESFSFN